MKRFLGLGLIVALAFTAFALQAPTPTHADANASISVSPSSGSQNDTFTFAGINFDPGEQLGVVYQDPNGQQFTYMTPDGNPDLVTADGSGNFILTVHPVTDFSGAAPGTWTVAFCSTSGQCWSGTIDISL